MIPGSNLLNMAFSVISQQTVTYLAATGRALNSVGQDVTSYAPPASLRGSFQPVPRRLYEQYGLDLQKTYYTFYASKDIIDIGRDVSCDQIIFENRVFQCESSNDWFAVDGWAGVLCVLSDAEMVQPAFGLGDNPNYTNGSYDEDGA